MDYNEPGRTGSHRDPWPVIRLLMVFAAMGFWAHWRFAWKPPAPSAVQTTAVGMLGVFLFCGLISITLARFYLALVLFPVYATTKLNAWLYEFCYWLFRTILRLLYIRRASAIVALLGELGLFVLLWRLVELLLRKYCL